MSKTVRLLGYDKVTGELKVIEENLNALRYSTTDYMLPDKNKIYLKTKVKFADKNRCYEAKNKKELDRIFDGKLDYLIKDNKVELYESQAMKIEKKIWKLIRKSLYLTKDEIKKLKVSYDKGIINVSFNLLEDNEQRKFAKKAYKIWKKVKTENITIDRNLYNCIAFYRGWYLDTLPSAKKFVKKVLNNDKQVIENWVMSQPFEYLKDELLYKETVEFFKDKTRNTSFWKRDLIQLLSDLI